ncbi:hypothetical protein EMIHUDRAFT_256243 [Emiliania huxleyi CCMP1516]|uniref:Uncharacterized protein n=2 Tax=Emiliania huxleyi TaxID=2903 RepID=A0A0D3IY30_EMIH1|nr:hypothetical protein EMIHUDRAFT_256243 [Emiliania huxleyi CCMP1516]EOD16165.1 hypothetical protein EMIHUDRAFT_256243 [Emiliania huxleyi CCMP1516]|eukprot:XP_005768594.1 hypothetical protein EMIHUDRAFT_256243 [Emiliania huxleyi CCMP1516]
MVEAVASLVGGLDALRVLHTATEAHVEENRFANPPSELVFGRPAQAALGVEHCMHMHMCICVPREAVLHGLLEGTAAIVREGGLKRDCDEHEFFAIAASSKPPAAMAAACRNSRRTGGLCFFCVSRAVDPEEFFLKAPANILLGTRESWSLDT